MVRAANGILVAAMRSDMPLNNSTSLTTTSWKGRRFQFSKDDGKIWSEMRFLFHAGRHHANLHRLEDVYWVDGKCGQPGSVVLEEDQIISTSGHDELGSAVFIKWKPGK
jgi:hypothetical protein